MIAGLKYSLIFSLMAGITFLGGCVDTNGTEVVKNYYLLSAVRDGKANSGCDKVLKVIDFTVSCSFASKSLVYRKTENSFENDYYNKFFTSPDKIICEQTRNWLAESGLFKNVLSQQNVVSEDIMLEANVVEIYGDFVDSESSAAVMKIQFILLNNEVDGFDIILDEVYSARVPFEEKTPDCLIKAYNNCLKQILTKFEQDIRKLELDS